MAVTVTAEKSVEICTQGFQIDRATSYKWTDKLRSPVRRRAPHFCVTHPFRKATLKNIRIEAKQFIFYVIFELCDLDDICDPNFKVCLLLNFCNWAGLLTFV